MRPIATEQDSLRHPLNEVFGTRAGVRLMRLLADDVSEPIGAPDAAAKTGLPEAGARRALRRLATTGFVERIGGGRAQEFQLRRSDPLAEQIRVLFAAERDRYQSLLSALKDVLGAFREVRVAWIDDAPADLGSPLHVGILSDARSLGYLATEVRRRIEGIERRYDLPIELRTFTSADLPEVEWEGTVLLAGHPEVAPSDLHPPATHGDRTQRAVRMSRAIADLVDRDPSLVRRAEKHLELLLRQDQGPASHDLREWRGILRNYSRQRILDFLVSETPRA